MRPAPAMAAALLLLAATPAANATASARPTGLLILPFENTAEDPSLAWLSTGLALHTGEDLRGYGCAVVEDEDRAVLLEGSGIPSGASLTLASALELGRKMRARPVEVRPDRLVLGRFNVQEGELTLSGRVIDLETERARPWITRQGRLKDLMEVHTSLVEALARDGDLHGSGHRIKTRGADPDPPLLAFETYSRAMAESDTRKRLTLLRRAFQESPGYPAAAYQAAAILVRSERWDEASEMLQKASSDAHPYEAEFHLLVATVALQKQDAAGAADAARQSLGFTPSARGHAILGRALLYQGDAAGARQEMDTAVAIDPSETEIDELRKQLKQVPQAAGRTP